jgi:hypothetical protein
MTVAGSVLEELETGLLSAFADWPNDELRGGGPGVYSVWRGDEFLYVGISWQDEPGSAGLFGRLNSHATGRRSGDQFCIYICDRFIVPSLDLEQLSAIGAGTLSLDQMTRSYIRTHLTYRSVHTATGDEARLIERAIRREGLGSGVKPAINPLKPPM